MRVLFKGVQCQVICVTVIKVGILVVLRGCRFQNVNMAQRGVVDLNIRCLYTSYLPLSLFLSMLLSCKV